MRETGLNFPDLGLLEALAAVLGTTPAQLLGLEAADQEELLQSLAELSREPLERARRDLKWAGWGCILICALLCLIYSWYGNKTDPGQKVLGYQLLSWMIGILGAGGIWLLLRHGFIRQWKIGDWLIFYGAGLCCLVFLGIQFFTGRNPPLWLSCLLISLGAALVQILCCRILAGPIAQALPSLGCIALLIFFTAGDILLADFGLGAAACFASYLACRLRDRKHPAPEKKMIFACLLASAILFGCFFRDTLIRCYVQLNHAALEGYCRELLENSDGSGRYGPWQVSAYPEAGLVEFHTGGDGLAPSSHYEGFYYSQGDTHLAFQALPLPMEDRGSSASWRDGTDNHGTSRRLRDNFFWFEAWF